MSKTTLNFTMYITWDDHMLYFTLPFWHILIIFTVVDYTTPEQVFYHWIVCLPTIVFKVTGGKSESREITLNKCQTKGSTCIYKWLAIIYKVNQVLVA